MQLNRITSGALAGLILAVSAAAQVEPAPAAAVPRMSQGPDLSAVGPGFRLGPGTQILVRAANAPDLNEKTFRVDPDGSINAPLVGRVEAAGLTAAELEDVFVKKLGVLLQQPQVNITVSDYPTQPVSVFGEVMSPGVQQLIGSTSLVELLARAGGVRATAGPTVRITRRIENGAVPLPGAATDASGRFSVARLELKPLTEGRAPETDIRIMPNDIVSVPKAEMIYIAGDVTRSGAVNLTDRSTMSVLEALSATGGVTKTADTKKARILRTVAGNPIREQLPVDISRIMSGKSSDVELVAGDILVVPPSNMKKAAQRALEMAVQVGTVVLSSGIATGAL